MEWRQKTRTQHFHSCAIFNTPLLSVPAIDLNACGYIVVKITLYPKLAIHSAIIANFALILVWEVYVQRCTSVYVWNNVHNMRKN